MLRMDQVHVIRHKVLREGASIRQVALELGLSRNNEWVRRTPDYHICRAVEHLKALQDGDQRQDHVAHAATRLLMALTLREIG